MNKRKMLLCLLIVMTSASMFYLTGCSGGAYKSSGQYKRDILIDRIEKARECHELAKKQFQIISVDYSNVVIASQEDIRDKYNKLDKQHKETKAVTVQLCRRVKDVIKAGKPLFRNWEDELDEYQNESIRRSSEEQLNKARTDYLKIVHAIKNTESKTANILKSLDDQMLFFSQNLNADALSALKDEISTLKNNLKDLDKQMDKAIKETEKFGKSNPTTLTKFKKKILPIPSRTGNKTNP